MSLSGTFVRNYLKGPRWARKLGKDGPSGWKQLSGTCSGTCSGTGTGSR